MLFFPPAAQAAQPAPAPSRSFDLAAALALARAENPLLRAARARVEERQGLITSTRADALPQLTLTGDYTRLRDVSLLNSNIGPALAASGYTVDQLVAPTTTYTAQAALSQPLFYWGKLGTAVAVARMGEREANLACTTAELDVLHGVAKAYLAVLSAQAELEVVQARRATAEQFVAEVKARLEAQTATELDRLRAESEYLGVVPENLQAEADYRRAMEQLDGMLGLDPRTVLALGDPGEPPRAFSGPAAERSEIAQYKQQEAIYRANDRIISTDLRPKVDLNASYGYQSGSTSNLFREPYDTWKVGVTLRFPVFDGLRTSGKRAQNRAQLEQVVQARVDKERAVAVETRSAERDLAKAVAYRGAAGAAYDAALEALRTSRESFEQGLITSLDLLQAEREERSRSSQKRRAGLAVWSALFDCRRAGGLPPLQETPEVSP
jgi:outer membrane protein TolC